MALQCRTCGSIIYNKMPKNLFHIENEKMLQDINLVTGTTLHNDPELPSSICACCTLDLNQAILFRERCILTQEQLVHQRKSPEAKEPAEDVEEMASPPDCLDDPFGEVDEYIVESPEEVLDRDDSDAHLDEDHYIDSVEDVDALQDMAEGQLKVAEEDSQDVESLVSSVQKELESIYNDDSNSDNNEVLQAQNDSYFHETINECELSSNPNTPLPELKSAADRSTKPTTTKPKRKKQYVTWKNMTEEQIIERKRLQRKRECVCEQCGRQFTDQSNFKLHMLRHTGNKNFACQQCGKRFYTDHLMTLHQRIIHQGEKPYDCRFCTMSFHNSNTRLIHERTHTNAKPYSCHHCDKCFKSASGRKRHELIHTGVRAFACTICKQSFQRNTHLKAHLRSKFHTAKARTMGAEVLQL
ncbi:transcription factor Ouib [Drosophila sechellia]|uniref:GM23960 n=1 Tax=Drosophila sechellia TaxID=7238 RepID=B4HI01_DROSE|nr:transcription factor Ouib [Drosophila sechellia]EDW42583.1 GM23960 [Drosophila sechellia]